MSLLAGKEEGMLGAAGSGVSGLLNVDMVLHTQSNVPIKTTLFTSSQVRYLCLSDVYI